MIGGDPALRTLARLKFRGALRKTLRRSKTFSGLIFMLVGGGLMVLWLASIYLSGDPSDRGPSATLDGIEFQPLIQAVMAFFMVISLSSAANVRGLYLPKNEIETLFASPVSRRDLVRYRMRTDALRALIGGIIFGLLMSRRAPVALYGFFGTMLALLTLGVVRQAVSLLLADVSGHLRAIFKPRLAKLVAIIGGIGIWMLTMTLVVGDDFLNKFLQVDDSASLLTAIFEHPLMRVLTSPFYPQAAAISAETTSEFLIWGGASLVIYLTLFELTARLPIDFREQSLETSATISKRIASVKRGGIFSGSKVDEKFASKRVPWFFGHGPYGAIAWVKATEILRKGRRGLFGSLFVVGMVAVVITLATSGDRDAASVGAPLAIAVLAVLYLSGGLRVDFRGELDRMERIKCWPLAPPRLFSAILVPQVCTVSALVSIAILLRAAVLDLWHPVIGATLIVLPFATFAWTAVDNLVFLFKPVRFIPGQEGTMHHTGRALVLLLLRIVLFGILLGLIGVFGFIAVYIAEEILEWGSTAIIFSIVAVAVPLFLLADWALCLAGGKLIQRFDVSRELG